MKDKKITAKMKKLKKVLRLTSIGHNPLDWKSVAVFNILSKLTRKKW